MEKLSLLIYRLLKQFFAPDIFMECDQGRLHSLIVISGRLISGGCTKVAMGDQNVDALYFADIGCVSLPERCPHSDPSTVAEVATARDIVLERLGEPLRVVPGGRARTGVCAADTFIMMAARAQMMTTYDSDPVHLSRIGFTKLLPLCVDLIAITRKQRAALGLLHKGRVDVIGGGAIVVEELVHA